MRLPSYTYFSRAPTSGGQYHWVSEFAPPEYQKFLSYASGSCIVCLVECFEFTYNRLDVNSGLARKCGFEHLCRRNAGSSYDRGDQCQLRLPKLAVHADHACLSGRHYILQYLGCKGLANARNHFPFRTSRRVPRRHDTNPGPLPKELGARRVPRGRQQRRVE